MSYWIEILFFYFLAGSAFLSAVEAAYLSFKRVSINRFEKKKGLLDKIIYFFINNFKKFIVSILLLNLGNNIVAVWLFGKILDKHTTLAYHWSGQIIQAIAMTFILLLFCEVTPKRIGIHYNHLIAYMSALPLLLIYYLFYPFSYAFELFSNKFLKLIKNDKLAETDNIDKEEFLSYIRLSSDQGVLEDLENDMLRNLISNKDLSVKSIIIPRPMMKGFDLSNLPENIPLSIRQFKYNVIPVYDKVKDNIKGVLSKKKILFQGSVFEIDKHNLNKYLQTPKIVPENKKIVEVLEHMRREDHELSLVTDEYGGIEGFVTYRDIIGKLLAKSDDNESALTQVRRLSPTTAIVDPFMPLAEFNERFKTHIHCQEAETIGGFLIETNHDIPKPGHTHIEGKIKIIVKSSNKRRIIKILVEVV